MIGIDYFREKRLHNNTFDPKSSGLVSGKSFGQKSKIKVKRAALQSMFSETLYSSPADLQKLVIQAFAKATGGTETCDELANELLHLHSPITGFLTLPLFFFLNRVVLFHYP